ncbi:hypothetical protein JCM11491_004027 [Sporobolomyces phaffii]
MSSATHSDDDGPQDEVAYWGSTQRNPRQASTRVTGSTAGPSSQTSSSNANGKGKGKALSEGDTGTSEPKDSGNGTRHDIALQRTRDDLQLLASMDPAMAARLVELDPTPTHQLATTTKIMKAISILASTSSFTQEMNLGADRATSGVPFPEVIDLLASALSDVSQAYPDLRSRPKPISLHHLEIARAKLSLPLQDAVPPSGSPGVSQALLAVTPSGHPILLEELAAPPSEAAVLFAENARLALSALRPSSLFPSPQYSSETPTTPVSTSRPASPHSGPSPIAVLPSELLLYIFQFAQAAAAEPVNDPAPQSGSMGRTPPIVTEVWAGRGRRSVRDEYGNPVNRLSGSKAAAQRFALALARVCRAWLEPARTVAFRHVYIYQGPQLAELLSGLAESPSLGRAAPSILAISATLAPPGSNEAPSNSAGPSITLNRMLGRITARRGRPSTPVSFGGARTKPDAEGGSSGGGKGGEGKTPAEMWSQIVEMCPNIKKLKLRILPSSSRWAGFSRSPSMTEFLDAAVLGTLSSTHGLKTLNLAFSIDFEELEVIMNGLPNLESVSIRAIDAISGSAAVSSTGPHPAQNIRYFKLGDSNSNSPYNIQEYTSISDVQLAWILEPAVASASLRELDVSILIDPGIGGGWPPGLPGGPANFGANANSPPFASSTIADLLIRCGDNLERLALRDLAETGSMNPNFAAAPHNANFDHALSSLTTLRDLSLQFAYTGANFLDSLSSIPRLRHLSLSGTPVHTSADLFADKLDRGLGELESLTISGQFAGTRGGQGGWNGAGVRRVKQAAKDRGLQGAFGG